MIFWPICVSEIQNESNASNENNESNENKEREMLNTHTHTRKKKTFVFEQRQYISNPWSLRVTCGLVNVFVKEEKKRRKEEKKKRRKEEIKKYYYIPHVTQLC